MNMRRNAAILVAIASVLFLLTIFGGQPASAQNDPEGGITVVPTITLTPVPITPTATFVITSTIVPPPPTLTAVPITPTFEVTVVPTVTNKAIGLNFVPAANTVRVGEVFTKEVYLHEISNAGPMMVDEVRVGVHFDPNFLRVVGIKTGEALIPVRAHFDNKGGSFGYEGIGEVEVGDIRLLTVEFKALAPTTEPPFGATAIYPSDVEISHQSERINTISVVDLVYIVEEEPTATPTATPTPTPCPVEVTAGEDVNLANWFRWFRDEIMANSAEGRRWIERFQTHAPEIASILIKDKSLREETLGWLKWFEGNWGKEQPISTEQIEKLSAALDKFAAVASPKLQTTIKTVRGSAGKYVNWKLRDAVYAELNK